MVVRGVVGDTLLLASCHVANIEEGDTTILLHVVLCEGVCELAAIG